MSRQVHHGSHDAERGFSLLEALIAIGIIVLVALCGLLACSSLAHTAITATDEQRSTAAIDTQATLLRNDAATAFAVYLPAAGDAAVQATEIDFFAKDDAGRALRWRYRYDPRAHTLQRSDYDATGSSGVRDVRTGVIDPAAVYPPLGGITHFTATALAADTLGDSQRNPYSGIAALFSTVPQARSVRYDAPGAGLPAAIGGNGIVQIVLGNDTATRVIHLVAGSMAAGFTITGVPVWHAIVYRVDQSHRFLLGAASKSHVFINARVDVSYDGWNTRLRWCEFNLLGAPDGLDGDDVHADYTPAEPVEHAENILAACRARRPVPPAATETENPPDADALAPPLPGQTAPPCWVHPGPGGRCWPAAAPADWAPPSPAPLESPPPAWCAAHPRSPACRSTAHERP